MVEIHFVGTWLLASLHVTIYLFGWYSFMKLLFSLVDMFARWLLIGRTRDKK